MFYLQQPFQLDFLHIAAEVAFDLLRFAMIWDDYWLVNLWHPTEEPCQGEWLCHPRGELRQQLIHQCLHWGSLIDIPCVIYIASGVGAVLQAARKMDAPIMIQFSAGGSQFYAGKGLDTLLQLALGAWVFRKDLVWILRIRQIISLRGVDVDKDPSCQGRMIVRYKYNNLKLVT